MSDLTLYGSRLDRPMATWNAFIAPTLKQIQEALGTDMNVGSCDVIEGTDAYTIHMHVPGFSKEDVDVQIDNNVVRIKATRKSEESSEGRYLMREIVKQDVQREFRLAKGVDSEKVQAKLENGVLVLHLPFRESDKVKSIAIN